MVKTTVSGATLLAGAGVVIAGVKGAADPGVPVAGFGAGVPGCWASATTEARAARPEIANTRANTENFMIGAFIVAGCDSGRRFADTLDPCHVLEESKPEEPSLFAPWEA